MRKLIKYRRMYAMLMLIVLVFSNTQVHAQITDAPSEVQGSGTEQDPYIIAVSGGAGGKVVIKPEKVPFYFKVRGTGGVGGVFAIDYDIEKGLVSFQLTDTVTVTGVGSTSASVNFKDTNETSDSKYLQYQLGIAFNVAKEVEQPKYKIEEVYAQVVFQVNAHHKHCPNGANVKDSSSDFSRNSKNDLYFFAKDTQSLKDLIELYEASGYQYVEEDPNDDVKVFWIFDSQERNPILIPKREYVPENEVVSLMYKFDGLTNTASGDPAGDLTLEAIISRVFMAFGDVLLYMIQLIFGRDLTINSLIFNTYDDTKLDFYSSNPSGLSKGLADVVNNWYKIFSKLAYVLYVVILVYIGVMILVSSGTGDQDKRKKSLGDWFAGLAIMFAVPTFVIPSLIKLNDAFVKFMSSKNSEEITTYYNSYVTGTDILGGDSATLSIEELMQMRQETSKELEENEKKTDEMLDTLMSSVLKDSKDKKGYTPTQTEIDAVREVFKELYSSVKFYYNNVSSNREEWQGSLYSNTRSKLHYMRAPKPQGTRRNRS